MAMALYQARYVFEEIEPIRQQICAIGSEPRGMYFFTDEIVNSNDDLNMHLLRLRCYQINIMLKSKVELTEKTMRWKDFFKVDTIHYQKDFVNFTDAVLHAEDRFGSYVPVVSFARQGWAYCLDGMHLFLEYIDTLGPSLGIEGDCTRCIINLAKQLRLSDPARSSVPKLVQNATRNVLH